MPAATDTFEEHRDHLTTVAYRMLGSRADAEDAVQEAWLRWRRAGSVADPRAWLTTVTSRICLDQLRSARARRETYPGQWLPEPWVERLPAAGTDPAEQVVRRDAVSYALLVVMERLSPEQRVAFVLHDVFAVPFDEIATVLSVSALAARKLASRARAAVTGDGAIRHTADLAEQRRVAEAFLAAAQAGDIPALVAALAPDVVAIGDGGGRAPAGRRPIRGRDEVARLVVGLLTRHWQRAQWAYAEPVLINGGFGLVAEYRSAGGRTTRTTMTFAVADGRITGVFSQLNPDKLARVPAVSPAAPRE